MELGRRIYEEVIRNRKLRDLVKQSVAVQQPRALTAKETHDPHAMCYCQGNLMDVHEVKTEDMLAMTFKTFLSTHYKVETVYATGRNIAASVTVQ